MKFVILSALALSFAVPAAASAAETYVVIKTHHKHYNTNQDTTAINEGGQRLHHRHHGQLAFYDQGQRNWHRHHRHNTVVVVSSVPTRHLHRPHPIVIENNDY